jgi:peptidyl-tRNA hydrolase, PTH1 family
MIRLIVGLGNPGGEYQKTRHNAGVWFIEQLCRAQQANLRPKKAFHGQYTYLHLAESVSLYLLVPTTFMNNSGRAVQAMARYYKINPTEMLIVHDELDFLPGVVRLKLGGSGGGHNGLNDIIRLCGTNQFWRLRIGIGHPGDKWQVRQYVLNPPAVVERDKIQDIIQKVIALLPDFCMGKTEPVMRALHT